MFRSTNVDQPGENNVGEVTVIPVHRGLAEFYAFNVWPSWEERHLTINVMPFVSFAIMTVEKMIVDPDIAERIFM